MKRVSSFAKRLKTYRESNKWTLAQLEEKTGVPAPTLNRYELGQRVPKIDMAIEIATSLNINLLWLQGYDASITMPQSEMTPYERIVSLLPLVNAPVSAGTGQWLAEGYEYEFYEFYDAPKDADFALRVRGDSMSPLFNDDDIVYVKTCVQVESGQVGVFYLNGEGYMKMLQGNRLISHNSKYKPIIMNEFDSFFVAGRVVGKVK